MMLSYLIRVARKRGTDTHACYLESAGPRSSVRPSSETTTISERRGHRSFAELNGSASGGVCLRRRVAPSVTSRHARFSRNWGTSVRDIQEADDEGATLGTGEEVVLLSISVTKKTCARTWMTKPPTCCQESQLLRKCPSFFFIFIFFTESFW